MRVSSENPFLRLFLPQKRLERPEASGARRQWNGVEAGACPIDFKKVIFFVKEFTFIIRKFFPN